jgi:hypothetical protein
MGMKHHTHSVEHLARILTAPDMLEHLRREGDEDRTRHDETCRVDVELSKRVVKTTEGLSWAANRALIEQLRRNAGEFSWGACVQVVLLLMPGDCSAERYAVKGSEENVGSPC